MKPLIAGLAAPVRVVPVARDAAVSPADWSAGEWRALRGLLNRVARRAGVTGLTLTRNEVFDDLQVFERVVSERLALADWMNSAAAVPVDRLGEVDQVVAETLADSFDVFSHKEAITSVDGVPLNVYAAGQADEAVVLVPACGMPAALAESWVRFLARDRRVLTWESRGLFDAADHGGDYSIDIGAQAADLFTVMDHYGVTSAHVVGLCGGAVIALAAAAEQSGRVSSLSLWHGAYEFTDGGMKTKHQEGLIELMTSAARSRAAARAVHAAFCQAMLTSTPADVAHLVLYPYASPELLYRYCRLNTGITSTDVGPYLAKVKQPTLVVTSQDDDIAHPAGSQQVAAGLSNGHLRVEDHGDHISLFNADEKLLRVAADFMAQH
ncbi:alpha/beta hydrolase [Streptomyces sp. P9-2B-2]|uniref:alpha/beta fold hydrolase n=1 Tax=Streptomyces sp. P9-2B-2 TaxID=3057114 RepID=UPI0025B418D0|nr:alpha/beta hydrolase [Streptomyces sp. P9-2B-2]WJY37077.1 alpha/beta hydrolase [Streptomyces sp. P9-2B-2]